MKITLTDISGVKFNIESFVIDEVKRGTPTTLILKTGEKLTVKESASYVLKLIIDANFN